MHLLLVFLLLVGPVAGQVPLEEPAPLDPWQRLQLHDAARLRELAWRVYQQQQQLAELEAYQRRLAEYNAELAAWYERQAARAQQVQPTRYAAQVPQPSATRYTLPPGRIWPGPMEPVVEKPDPDAAYRERYERLRRRMRAIGAGDLPQWQQQ